MIVITMFVGVVSMPSTRSMKRTASMTLDMLRAKERLYLSLSLISSFLGKKAQERAYPGINNNRTKPAIILRVSNIIELFIFL